MEQTLEGRADRLKDYTLGAEALGRGDDFDPRVDPVARVEASRLRSRLELYYATEGVSDDFRIVLPKGGYVPRLERQTPAAGAQPTAGEPASRRTVMWLGAAGLVLGVLALAGWLTRQPSASENPPEETWTEITTPPTTDSASLAVAPDGRSLVFVASAGDVPRLWLRRLDSRTSRGLPLTEHATLPFWSPDSREVGFFADGAIKAIDLQTGLIRALSSALVPAGASWSPEGIILHPVVPDGPLFRTSSSGGPLTPATELSPGQTGHRGPLFLPDGRRFLFHASGDPSVRGLYLGELGTMEVRRLVDADSSGVFVPPDVILYMRGATLLAQRLDASSGTFAGEPVAVAENFSADPIAARPLVSASATGTLAFRPRADGGRRLFVWYDRTTGRELSRVGSPEVRGPAYASISPDGRRLALQRSVDGNTDIWLVDLERGALERLTSGPAPDIAPIWSPLGDRIAYASQQDRTFQLFERPLSGGEAALIVKTAHAKQPTDWSRDGRYLVFRSVTTGPRFDMDVWAIDLEGAREPVPVVRSPFEERDAQLSRDSQWIAYQSNESGRPEIYARPFLREGERVPVSTSGGVQVRWRADGRELFYLTLDGELMAVQVVAADREGRELRLSPPTPLFRVPVGPVLGVALPAYIAADDGQRFLFDTLVESQPDPISLVFGWKARPGGIFQDSR